MILLINEERVVAEVMELARLKISGILSMSPDDVSALVEVEDGKIRPNFQLKVAVEKDYEKAFIQRTMADVWMNVAKPQLVERLRGLNERRYGFEEETATKKKASEEVAPEEEAAPEEGGAEDGKAGSPNEG